MPSDPRNQLWITERDGSSPRLVGVNIGTADWSPNGKRLAVAVAVGINVYIYTIDLETLEETQWTGREDQFFSKPTVSNPIWFQDGRHLLVGVMAEAYQQAFERGIYVIDTETGDVEGPLVEVMQSAFLGGKDSYITGKKYTYESNPRSGNYAKYVFASDEWTWITDFSEDTLDFVDAPAPSPTGDVLAQSRIVENAEQLFLMTSEGEGVRQITRLGGDNPRWSYSGDFFVFRRDVHQGQGARYVPFTYELSTEEVVPLFPAQPDSLPPFPPLSKQILSQTPGRR